MYKFLRGIVIIFVTGFLESSQNVNRVGGARNLISYGNQFGRQIIITTNLVKQNSRLLKYPQERLQFRGNPEHTDWPINPRASNSHSKTFPPKRQPRVIETENVLLWSVSIYCVIFRIQIKTKQPVPGPDPSTHTSPLSHDQIMGNRERFERPTSHIYAV